MELSTTMRDQLIDELLSGHNPSSVMRQDGLLGELKKALLNRLMAGGLAHHLAEERTAGESRSKLPTIIIRHQHQHHHHHQQQQQQQQHQHGHHSGGVAETRS